MILRWIYLFFFPLMVATTSVTTNVNLLSTTPPKTESYDALWAKIEKLEDDGKPKSAREVAQFILKKAKDENNGPQQVKAILYVMRYNSNLEENADLLNIKFIESQINSSKDVALKSILQSIEAQSFSAYRSAHNYKIMQRTITDDTPEQIDEWNPRNFEDKIRELFLSSISQRDFLSQIPVRKYADVLDTQKNSNVYRPTIFDLLAYRAIDYFGNDQSMLTRASEKNSTTSLVYLQPFDGANGFGSIDFTNSTYSQYNSNWISLHIYQQILNLHVKDKNPEAFVIADLVRLEFAKKITTNSQTDSFYYERLLELENKYTNDAIGAQVAYQRALFINNGFRPSDLEKKISNATKAHAICSEWIKKFPESFGSINCRALISQIEHKSFGISASEHPQPDRVIKIRVEWKNISKVWYRVILVKDQDEKKLAELDGIKYYKALLSLNSVNSGSWALYDEHNYMPSSTDVILSALKPGKYYILACGEESFTPSEELMAVVKLQVTNLHLITEDKTFRDKTTNYVLDAGSGLPVKDAKIQLTYRESYQDKSPLTKNYTTDADGSFEVEKTNTWGNINVVITKDEDRLDEILRLSNYYKPNNQDNSSTSIFTDRAIYRPGQMVYFKAIEINKKSIDQKSTYSILPNDEIEFTLLDVNQTKVSSVKAKTNEFGSCAGSFVLPVGLLNGQFSISSTNGVQYFSVEEYKRPGFEVLLDTPTVANKLNAPIKIKGKAVSYSGVNLASCKVTYRVVRNARYITWRWWLPIPKGIEKQIADGTTETDKDGKFEISFIAEPGEQLKGIQSVFNYTTYADVTDLTGETLGSSIITTIGDVALTALVDIPTSIDKTQSYVYKVLVNNLDQQPMAVSGKITLQELEQPNRLLRARILSKVDTQLIDKNKYSELFPNDVYRDENEVYNYPVKKTWIEQQVSSNINIDLSQNQLKNLPVGIYKISYETKDEFGQAVKAVKFITVFDSKSKKTVIQDYFYAFGTKTENLKPTENAELIVGSATSIRVRLVATHNGKILLDKWLTLSNEQQKITIPITEQERGGVNVHLFTYKDNRAFAKNILITVPEKSTMLEIIPGIVHNTLKPGQKDQWKMKIKGPDGGVPLSEMMITMYDASLDAFTPHQWNFNLSKHYMDGYSVNLNGIAGISNSTNWGKVSGNYWLQYDNLKFFNSFYPIYGNYNYMRIYSFKNESVKMKNIDLNDGYSLSAPMGVEREDKNFDSSTNSTNKKPEEENKVAENTRTNLNELAFFYPQLQTDKEGNVSFDFTMPDALTKWKVMAFAHDKALDYGQYTTTVVTQKELMVQPYLPRFLRVGDSVVISAKISNLSEKALKVNWDGGFYDVNVSSTSDKNIVKPEISKSSGKITLEIGESKEISFVLAVPDGPEGITYQITAQSKQYFDRQEGLIPVLPNRKLVTESLSLPIYGQGTQVFDFNSLLKFKNSPTLSPYKVKVEMTSNPSWYAVQALPYLIDYPYESAEQTFNRYYANAISQYIVQSNPRILKVYEQWKKEGSEALLSNLEKNQDIKNILLQETPWVLEAKNESEQKQRIAQLFEPNIVNNNLLSAITKLKALQQYDGGWPWFEGMKSNPYITQNILEGIAHLKSLGIKTPYDSDIESIANSALSFIDKNMNEDYKDLLKYKADLKADQLSALMVHYLYIRSFYTEKKIGVGNKIAYNFWLNQAKTYGLKHSLYEKALLTSTWYRLNEKTLGEKYITSLKEFSLYSPEFGMYWKANSRGWYWYQDMTQTQCMLIEAFQLAGANTEVEQMKVWLLKQKQTQNWPTTIATAQAVYALLSTGRSWIESNELVKIWLGPNEIKPDEGQKPEPGTGYWSKNFSRSEISPDMGKVKVEKKDSGIAWGAVYFQYYEQLDKIGIAGKELQIIKKVYLKITTKDGLALQELKPGMQLKTGDLLTVKLEIRTDRTLEYVHIKDQRAGALEPLETLSGYIYKGGVGYYQSVKDASMNYFVDRMPKGNYSLEYDLRVNQAGRYSNGIAEIQCMYAPEFSAHSDGVILEVGK